jgi:hypothetical protein
VVEEGYLHATPAQYGQRALPRGCLGCPLLMVQLEPTAFETKIWAGGRRWFHAVPQDLPRAPGFFLTGIRSVQKIGAESAVSAKKNVPPPPELKMQFRMKLEAGSQRPWEKFPRCLGQETRKSIFANGLDKRLKVRSLLVADSCPAKPPVSQCQSQQSRACEHPGGYTSTTRRFLLSLSASTFALATSYPQDLGDLPYANSL